MTPARPKAATPARGRVMKAFFVDGDRHIIGETRSKQLPEDDFRSLYGQDIQEPPFSLEQLVFLAEQHPVHNAALAQKSADVIGLGWEWKSSKDGGQSKNDSLKDQLEEWFSNLIDDRRDETMHEILLNAWDDMETVGQGLIELARDPSGKIKYCYPMPAHTVRFARDGIRVVQIRQGKRVWFKRWIPKDEMVVGMNNGLVYENRRSTKAVIGNEVLVIKKPARRSSWYGIPTYISALGWIVLSILARDDNIFYFENRREPRWAIILTNLDDDPDLEDNLKEALQIDLKQPHRNLVIPIEGPGNIEFKQLSDLKDNDMSFEKLQERAGEYILVGHRMPSDRLGLTKVGPLGGDVAVDASRVYKEGVVQTSQAVLAARINRFVKWESNIANKEWEWHPLELDLTEEDADVNRGTTTFQAGLVTLNEARVMVGEPPLDDSDERGDMFITELGQMAQSQAAGEGQGQPQYDQNGNEINPDTGQAFTPQELQQRDAQQQPQQDQPPPKKKKPGAAVASA